MQEPQIRFDDGAAYEEFMGKWSWPVGEIFLQWLAPRTGARWIDVGCGNGVFTEMIVKRCAPAAVHGVDPSAEQLAFARSRPATRTLPFDLGDAMALPHADASFDAAVMALVLFFVPDPARGVAEMVRVVAPGGSVSAYAWDILGGGFPLFAMHEEMTALGTPPLWPPSVEAARIDAMQHLWTATGLEAVETREITVQRSFTNFDDYWRIALSGPGIAPKLGAMSAGDVELLKTRLRARLGADADGRVTCSARANAVKGRVPEPFNGRQSTG